MRRETRHLIALKFALLFEEYSMAEISEALELMKEDGVPISLLSQLQTINTEYPQPRQRVYDANKKDKPAQRSKAVSNLEQSDPDKFSILLPFESAMRAGHILTDQDDIRRIGHKMSKDFTTGKSRQETISKFLSLLAMKSIDEIREIVKQINSTSQRKTSEFQLLADYYITGTSQNSSSEDRDADHLPSTVRSEESKLSEATTSEGSPGQTGKTEANRREPEKVISMISNTEIAEASETSMPVLDLSPT